MSRFLCAYLCIFSLTANAAGPVLWGGNDRAQNLTAQGVTLSSGVTIDNDGLNNFVKASTAETATQPAAWSTYADAAGVVPVDCTGGSANITWTRNTTTPLRGAADFKLTKDASNRQGQGVSYAFTTGPSDGSAKLMTISFELKSNEDAAYATSDIDVYIYNVTGAALITPVVTSVVDGAYTFTSQFPLASSSSYRLCFHVATTNASAYDVYFDNVAVAGIEGVGFGQAIGTTSGLLPPVTSMSDVLATQLGYKQYLHGTSYNGGNAPTLSGTNWTTTRSVCVPYQMQDGTWRMKINFYGTLSGAANTNGILLSLNGVTFKNSSSWQQAIAVKVDSGTPITNNVSAYANGNSDDIIIIYNGGAINMNDEYAGSGDVELDSKPNWAY